MNLPKTWTERKRQISDTSNSKQEENDKEELMIKNDAVPNEDQNNILE